MSHSYDRRDYPEWTEEWEQEVLNKAMNTKEGRIAMGSVFMSNDDALSALATELRMPGLGDFIHEKLAENKDDLSEEKYQRMKDEGEIL